MDTPTLVVTLLKEVPLYTLVVLVLILAGIGGFYLGLGGRVRDKEGKWRRILDPRTQRNAAMIVSFFLVAAGIVIFVFIADRVIPPSPPAAVTEEPAAPAAVAPTTPAPAEEPTVEPAVVAPVVTESPPTSPPPATPLGWIYDSFDDACISVGKWFPMGQGTDGAEPTPIVRGDCFDFGPPDPIRHMVETGADLIIPAVRDADDGLISYWPQCQAREIQLVVSDYSYEGNTHGWVGLVVPHPEGSEPVIAVWISSRSIMGRVRTQVIATRGWVGSQASSTAQVLVADLPQHQEVVLGVAFDGEYARVLVGNVESTQLPPIPAVGFPYSFGIVYAVTPDSELSARIAEVRVTPLALTSWCSLTPTS